MAGNVHRATAAGQGNDQTRRHNLSTVLTALHHDGPQTRAELTRRTGLNRSTIAALVAELSLRGLAFETPATEAGTVGRPSPLVHPNSDVVALTVNPDIDAITVGLVGLGGRVHKRIRYETELPTVKKTVKIVTALVEGMQSELDSRFTVLGLGVAVPGLVRSDAMVTLAPHLEWREEPLAGPLTEALGYPVTAGNDAGAACLAESIYGAGRGVRELIYLNGSASGIGGGVLVRGIPLRGSSGYAGELGHTVVNAQGSRCHCGRIGCLETEVSRARLLEVLGRGSSEADHLDRLLAESDDDAVQIEVNRQLDWLALALGNLIGIFNPEAIVLGGFLGSLYAANPERLDEGVQEQTFASLVHGLRIERAELGPQLLTVGAAELVFAGLLADPAGYLARLDLPGEGVRPAL
ncbi:ROK family transcriptional regulator [Microlunatus panaciterrae]|uniref:NBD/HSP70 family sugar kinase n=1 Tax=Microlunatus panaciterrae TaxID=400768 RepID=A0ABS2RFN2_9ACTN|nr:ROK family transcriptional regulator [Microlunatus panaciterrae]MBM7797814.1 putative NBD/HSP70 family sugar kinase [Microlunatus panaciterrae]